MKRGLALLFIPVLLAALLTACSGGSNPVGTYRAKTINGQSIGDYFQEKADHIGIDLEDALGLVGLSPDGLGDLMTITLAEDGSAQVNAVGQAAKIGAWTLEGQQLTITVAGKPILFAFKGGEITADLDGDTLVLGK